MLAPANTLALVSAQSMQASASAHCFTSTQWQTDVSRLQTSAYILLASFSAVLFVAVIIGLRGAMVFHVWDNATNIESADRQIATRIANNTLPHMILVVAISDHDPETALNAVKSATRNIYDPQSITIYLCFNADEQTEAYLRIMQYLCKRKEHPVQGYPLRHCLEFDKIDFVLLRSRSNAQGLAYTEIRDVFKAMERRVCVVAFSADTVLYENCLFEFACGMEGRKDVVGLTGFVSGTCVDCIHFLGPPCTMLTEPLGHADRWTNKFSIATQMRECELLSAQILRRSIEAGTAIRLADLNAAVRNYVAEFECANFSHLGSRQLLQHVLIRQAKTCPLGFCAKARAKAQPTRTWRKYLTQSADLLVWDTGNEAHFLCDTRLWSHAPVMQVVRLLQLTIQSTLLFFTVVLVEFAGSKLLTFSTTTVVWIPILSYWTVMLLFGLLARRVTVFLLFPMMLTIEPWISEWICAEKA
nr:hypothetical protein HK105_005538 [Polyrhizophydium stewartii]